MKKLLMTLALASVLKIVYCQEKGVHFEQGLNWQQVKEKAEKEQKYIFVDCYATWCGPCKLMDKNVFSVDSVGRIVNQDYIAVRIQFDRTKDDNERIKAWYATVNNMTHDYQVDSYPTFLFFSPAGKILHKGVGYNGIDKFIALTKDAKDPNKQYYTQLLKYKTGKFGPQQTSAFAALARQIDKDEYQKIGADYIQSHLDKLSAEQFYDKQMLETLRNFQTSLHTNDQSFVRLLEHPEKADAVIGEKGYAFGIASGVIYSEYISPQVKQAKIDKATPDWDALSKLIADKFGAMYAAKDIVKAKLHWYDDAKDKHREFGKPSKNTARFGQPTTGKHPEIKNKDLIGLPWMVAFALRKQGWFLRQDIIWHKPNHMPESVTDRCTKAHEYIFLFSKSPKYYFDHAAIKTPAKGKTIADRTSRMARKAPENSLINCMRKERGPYDTANRRSVWSIITVPFKGAHSAAFPPELPELCVKAGSREGDIILDPFMGAGTTAIAALQLKRHFIGFELNPEYVKLAEERLLKS